MIERCDMSVTVYVSDEFAITIKHGKITNIDGNKYCRENTIAAVEHAMERHDASYRDRSKQLVTALHAAVRSAGDERHDD